MMINILLDYKEDRQLNFLESYLLCDVNIGAIADTLDYNGIEPKQLKQALASEQWGVVYDNQMYYLVNYWV